MLRWEWDFGEWGRAGLVPESDSVGFSFSRSTAGVKMFDPVASAVHPRNRITKLFCDGSGIWGEWGWAGLGWAWAGPGLG